MAFFATPYTIHFDDTMAYQSHHFLTSFKFQCAARETLLYGDLIFDRPGVPEALDAVHLFTADAYSRNLRPAFLGDRLVILLSLEEWGAVSARFCYRVLNQQGEPVCAGFQTHVCADAQTGHPIPLPDPLRDAFDEIRQISETAGTRSFRDCVLAGGEQTTQLFTPLVRQTAREYLAERYPSPRVIAPTLANDNQVLSSEVAEPPSHSEPATWFVDPSPEPEVWVFPGQGAFDARLLSRRISQCLSQDTAWRDRLDRCAEMVHQRIGGDAKGLLSGSADRCSQAVQLSPDLSQIGIFLQGVLGASLRMSASQPAVLLGHSLGEIAALMVAGSLSLSDGVLAVCERVRAIRDFGPKDGKLMAVMTDRSTVSEELALAELGSVVIAGRNHDHQTIVSGPDDQVARLRSRLQAMQIDTVAIASPTSFHHPVLQPAAQAWRQQLQQIQFCSPTTTVYSPIGRRMVDAADDIGTLLSSQLVRPFDLQGAIDDLALAGFSRLVDCGSSGVLARLLKAIAPPSMLVSRVDDHPSQDTEPSTSETSLPPASTPAAVFSEAENSEAGTSEAEEPESVAWAADSPATTAATETAVQPRVVLDNPRGQEQPSQMNADEPAASRLPAVAIVGQGCLLPARANSPEQLLAALLQGRSGIVDLREADPDWGRDFFSEVPATDRSTSALAGIVDNCDIVPPENVDPKFFEELSRPQKLLCIALAPCLSSLRKEDRVLCLVGATADGFQDQDRIAALRYAGIDSSDPAVVSRLGEQPAAWVDPYTAIRQVCDQLLPSGAPIRVIDAACASSLYSVALGMSALENDEVDVVLAGGVYCPGPGNNCLFSQFGGLTATGCRPFDASADGVVFSEGSAFVVLRRLSQARSMGQVPVAIVRGVGLSSDGRSPSANVPQTAGQMIAIRRCYENYDLSPASISAIEGHGTSTPAGDSTEVNSLRQFFSPHVTVPLPLHSLKGALGHTGWAAGTAAIIAVTQMLKARTFPGQANFHNPSPALAKSQQALFVPSQPLQLADGPCRIAIDGFGFGGANAHLVIEAVSDLKPTNLPGRHSLPRQSSADDELVVVACHNIIPSGSDQAGTYIENSREDSSKAQEMIRFDRQGIPLPKGTVVLPDLADDMDITQRLALSLMSETLGQLEGFNEDLRSQTSLVFVLEGKTERAVEATLRVLAPRFLADWQDFPEVESIQQAYDSSRPNGPYTLQCMMPNVAAGRAALQFNLNGPNFVLDAGNESLEGALASASLLLRSGPAAGTQLAIVAAIQANRWPVPDSSVGRAPQEYAAAFAITTRRTAAKYGFNVLSPLEALLERLQQLDAQHDGSVPATTAQKVAAIVQQLAAPQTVPATTTDLATPARSATLLQRAETGDRNALFDLHTPEWAEVPLDSLPRRNTQPAQERCLVIAQADLDLFEDLQPALAELVSDNLIVLVGKTAEALAKRLARSNVHAVDLVDEASARSLTDIIDRFLPNLILTVARPESWETQSALRQVANDPLGEASFVAVKHLASSVRSCQTEVWALFPKAWNDLIHPLTGPLSGMIKAIKREMPSARVGVISYRDGNMRSVLQRLQFERSLADIDETEIVYDGDRRLVRRLRRLTNQNPTNIATKAVPRLGKDSVILATGGARGVTAVMVEALLNDYGCTVIALGRSPLQPGPADPNSPEVERDFYAKMLATHPGTSPVAMRHSFRRAQASWEAHQRMDDLAQLPGQIRYMSVDVNDPAEVDQAVAGLQSEFGHIDLIMHGAGVQFSKRLEDRRLSEFRQTFDIKVGGLANLIESCQQHFGKIVPVHVLTSAYSIFGNDGQHDYGAANETLDRLCELSSNNGDSAWSSIAWSAWDGVGMTRGSEYQALAAERRLALLEPPEGQQIFRRVITGASLAVINVPLSQAEKTRYRVRTLPRNSLAQPQRTIEMAIQLSEMNYLQHHKARGIPTLPGAWIVEHMVRAVLRLSRQPVRYVTVENIQFRRFVRAQHPQDQKFRVIVDSTSSGFSAWLVGDIISPTGVHLTSDEVFASAFLSTTAPTNVAALDLPGRHPETAETWNRVTDPYCNVLESVQLSGPFDCLQQIAVSPSGRVATFSPKIRFAWHDVVPSLLLDASIRVAGMHAVNDALHVPTEIKRVVLPVGISTQSLDNSSWTIQASHPVVHGDDIRCGRVQVTDDIGAVRLLIEDAVVTRLR